MALASVAVDVVAVAAYQVTALEAVAYYRKDFDCSVALEGELVAWTCSLVAAAA